MDEILKSAASYLTDHYSPKLVWADRYPRVVSGNEEGVFGWAAVNHMLGHLGNGNIEDTVGTLDMGGSSTQITFVASEPKDIPDGYKFVLPFKDKVYSLYTHSFSGYGYNDARKNLLLESEQVTGATGMTGGPTITTLIDPCTLAGYTNTVDVDGTTVSLSGTGSWGDCTVRCKLLLSRGWPCVSIPGGTGVVTGNRRKSEVSTRGSVMASCGGVGPSGDSSQSKVLFVEPLSKEFFALSNFRDIERALGFEDQATVGQLEVRGKELCKTPWHKLMQRHPDLEEADLSTYCFGASYVYSILHDGYHFPDHLNVRFGKRIDVAGMDGVKISWTRGMILYETLKQGAVGFSGGDTIGAGDGSDNVWVGNMLMVGMFAAVITMAAGFAMSRSPAELREAVSEKLQWGKDKGAEAGEWAGEAAERAAHVGKRLATKLPSELPFDVPSVFRKGRGGYGEMVDEGAGEGLKGKKGAAMKDYGSIEDGRSGDASEVVDDKSWGFAFTKNFPQMWRGGTREETQPIAVRKSKSETSLAQLVTEPAGAEQEESAKEKCLVCEGRVKMGVEGKCGLCMARKDSADE